MIRKSLNQLRDYARAIADELSGKAEKDRLRLRLRAAAPNVSFEQAFRHVSQLATAAGWPDRRFGDRATFAGLWEGYCILRLAFDHYHATAFLKAGLMSGLIRTDRSVKIWVGSFMGQPIGRDEFRSLFEDLA